jgi:dethiobiotin synthetase
MKTLCVAGIGTLVGKTVVSAVLCERLGAQYWKPIGSGGDDDRDPETIERLITKGRERIVPSAYYFRAPLSPHVAAAMEGTTVDIAKLSLPIVNTPLVVELAGGLMVPLSDDLTNMDLLRLWRCPVVLVSRHYLGSINHTLLSIDALRHAGIELAGLVFNGRELPDSERIIVRRSRARVLGRIPELDKVNAETISNVVGEFELAL